MTGTSGDATTCVSLAEAKAINKIWHGQTADGRDMDPALDNAGSPTLASNDHMWQGQTRGTSQLINAGANPFPISTDMLALELQDPSYAQLNLVNAVSNGTDKWKTLDYAGLANAYNQGIALQPYFGNINTDNPDLSGLRDSGGMVLSYHGLADDFIMPQGSINYFTRVSTAMGGDAEVQKFNRLFLIPGMGHGTDRRVGSFDGSTGQLASANAVPLPSPVVENDQLFNTLIAWVEKGNAPSRIDLSSKDNSVSMPICSYPQKASYNGSGSVKAASSYSCK